ncbi:hypothetical protein ACFQ73_01840 [Amycolatopsis japonica]|uniref:hypothetical protein n=1 Tax=Amycolatopsis japonica TaxID=208439 RepID=UPI00366B4398
MTKPTSEPAATDVINGTVITARTPVLLQRALHPDADPAGTPVFGDATWRLAAALPDRHTSGQALTWVRYPLPLRHSCKLYAFALVNVVDEAPRLPNARTGVPGIKTLTADLGYLHPFTVWLVERGIRRFGDVGQSDLDSYYNHVTDKTGVSTSWKRKAFIAVQRLHAYRRFLPEHDRLPEGPIWGGASAAELADQPAVRKTENSTLRIQPEVMQKLLSAALLVTGTIADDLLPVAQRILAMRALAHQVSAHEQRPRFQGAERNTFSLGHLRRLLCAVTTAGLALPGRRIGDQIVLDHVGFATAGWFDREFLHRNVAGREVIAASGIPIMPGLFTAAEFTQVNDRPWREGDADAPTVLELLRHVTTACFLVIAYLSGLRTGEALNLRRGCISRNPTLGMVFLSGQQMKVSGARQDRSPATIPWVVTEQVADAVSVLEAIAPGPLLFPIEAIGTRDWIVDGAVSSRRAGSLGRDIPAFMRWFDSAVAPMIGHPAIGTDAGGKIVAPRLRRTLAWHIVRRPGGTVAGATQYGHVHTRIIQSYAGRADAGFLDEITFEEFLLRAETLHEDYRRLRHGEHVSGPAADAYRARVQAAERFAGLAITSPAQAATALANPDLQIHHGALLTCVYRPATAACRDDTADGPVWSRCRLTCANAARTDRDIAQLGEHADNLRTDLAIPGIPAPLRERIRDRVAEHERALVAHDTSRPGATSECAQ